MTLFHTSHQDRQERQRVKDKARRRIKRRLWHWRAVGKAVPILEALPASPVKANLRAWLKGFPFTAEEKRRLFVRAGLTTRGKAKGKL